MSLVLSRKKEEAIIIGESIVVRVIEIRGDKVRIAVDAPPEVPVHREEVFRAIQREHGVYKRKSERMVEKPPEVKPDVEEKKNE